jgi:hypothetical protein
MLFTENLPYRSRKSAVASRPFAATELGRHYSGGESVKNE